ncbi:39S ribosomal protein L32, mitochondrial-like [Argonauta hians]
MLRSALLRLEKDIDRLLNFKPALALVVSDTRNDSHQKTSTVLESIFDSFLWGAPKSRRSLEVRKTRKMGQLDYFGYAKPKKNIVACLHCGHYHEADTLCGNCYNKVRKETEAMKKAFGDDLKYSAPNKEVVFLYRDDQRADNRDKHVVELDRNRPGWFAKNLLTKSK